MQVTEFVVNTRGREFHLLSGTDLVCRSNFCIERPDSLYAETYVSLFNAETCKEHRREGYMSELLKAASEYVQDALGIRAILLNVFVSNQEAMNVYMKNGFRKYRQGYDSETYFTLIKELG